MSRRRTRHQDASNAIYFLILVNVLVYTFRDDLRPYLDINQAYSIHDGDYQSMLFSMFYHLNPGHLLLNMLALHRYGSEVFVNSSSHTWQSFFTVILSYLVCGTGSFLGIEWLSSYHDIQWQRKVSNARRASKCSHWMCQALNDVMGQDVSSMLTDGMADWTTMLTYGDEKLAIWQYKLTLRVGASGAIYGFMGMRLMTAFVSSHHSRINAMDLCFLLGTLAHDLSMSPITLGDLRDIAVFRGDGVDHAAHLFGALVGMALAILLMLLDRLKIKLAWWRSDGRRLGGNSEQSQSGLREDQEQRRREQSRLLNNRQSGGRRGQQPERTML